MRRFDTIIQIIISLTIFNLATFVIVNAAGQTRDIEEMLSSSIILFDVVMLIVLIIYGNLIKRERKAIKMRIDEFSSKGIRVYTKKYEKLMYSRDIADLPRTTKFFFDMNTLAVIQPKNLDELKEIIQLCKEYKIPIIPRASGTSGYGGTLPVKNGIVINLNYFDQVIDFNKEKMTVEVESNIIWKRLIKYLESEGFTLRSYPSSAPSSAVGGWISQGGYGIGSSYFGSVEYSIEEIQVIGSDGKNYTVNNPRCYVGSCGTLGIIWKVILNIEKKRALKHIALLGEDKEKLLESIHEFQKTKPYNLRFIDKQNLDCLISSKDWEKNHHVELFTKNEGVLSISYFKDEFEEENLTELERKYLLSRLSDQTAEALWEDRFYTLKIKRKGPSLIISEVIIPITKVKQFYQVLQRRFEEKKYMTELLSTKNSNAVIMVWFPVDIRRNNLPIIGSISYLFRWVRSFEVIQIARKFDGKPYSTGLWFGAYRNELLPKDCLNEIQHIKKTIDPDNILNPGKVFSMWVPRFFPLIKLSFAIKRIVPIITLLYGIIPRRYR